MKVYISGPISNNPHYRDQFAEAEDYLADLGVEIVNPVSLADALPPMNYGEYMKIDLQLLELCDAIYMVEGWEDSAGAKLEYHYARVWNKQVLHY